MGEWSIYGVPGGKEERGRTAWVMDTIFPVCGDMVIVAGVSTPETTAREEAITVIGELTWVLSEAWLGREDGGVG